MQVMMVMVLLVHQMVSHWRCCRILMVRATQNTWMSVERSSVDYYRAPDYGSRGLGHGFFWFRRVFNVASCGRDFSNFLHSNTIEMFERGKLNAQQRGFYLCQSRKYLFREEGNAGCLRHVVCTGMNAVIPALWFHPLMSAQYDS